MKTQSKGLSIYHCSLEYVPELKRKLWHVRGRGYVHSFCAGAFDEKELAETYCNMLNKS